MPMDRQRYGALYIDSAFRADVSFYFVKVWKHVAMNIVFHPSRRGGDPVTASPVFLITGEEVPLPHSPSSYTFRVLAHIVNL